MLEDMKSKAKETQNKVSQKISELAETGADRLKNVFHELAETSAAKIKEIISAATDAGVEKVNETIGSINQIIPVLLELGYKVSVMKITLSVIPEFVIEVSGLTKTIDEARFKKILEEKKNEKILIAILYALQKAKQMQGKVSIAGMKYDSVEIVLGLPPKITAIFMREKV